MTLWRRCGDANDASDAADVSDSIVSDRGICERTTASDCERLARLPVGSCLRSADTYPRAQTDRPRVLRLALDVRDGDYEQT